jgi:hypothetical protein
MSNDKPIFEPHYMAFPAPNAKFMKLRHPIESLVPRTTLTRRVHLMVRGFEPDSRDREVVEYAKADIQRKIYVEIYEELPKLYPDIPMNQFVFSTVSFEEDGIYSMSEGRTVDRWIEGTVTIYQKVDVLTAMVEAD